MVLPYLRNPRRRLQNQKQVHLEPDHTNTYDTSTYYRHVGRRTKGGRGGGFRMKTGGGDGVTNQLEFWIFIGVLCFCILLRIFLYWVEWNLKANYPEEQQQTEEDEDVPQDIKERKQLIRSKLHYEFVLSDRSNIKVENLREEGSKDDATGEASDGDDIDNDSVVVANHNGKKQNATSIATSSSSSSSVYITAARDILSNWRLQPKKKDVCSICLFRFHPGQTICVAKDDNRCCNSMFHETCLEAWLMDHDNCPLCQKNLME